MAVISIFNKCNSNCLMCTNPFGFREDSNNKYSKGKILNELRSKSRQIDEGDVIHFSGGEPTIHPDFLEILKETRQLFSKNTVNIATNGRLFSYPSFTKRVLEVNDLLLEVALHGSKRTHDAITRTPGSFEQTVDGLKNIFKYKNNSQKVEIRIIAMGLNYDRIEKICGMVYNKFPKTERIVIIFPELEGRAAENIKQVGIKYRKVTPRVQEITDRWAEEFNKYMLFHFPLCTLDSDYWQFTRKSYREDQDEIAFLDRCDRCLYKDYCVGIHKAYLKHFGKAEFSPVEEKKEGVEICPDSYHHPIVSS